jgi:hypothetical protein
MALAIAVAAKLDAPRRSPHPRLVQMITK